MISPLKADDNRKVSLSLGLLLSIRLPCGSCERVFAGLGVSYIAEYFAGLACVSIAKFVAEAAATNT
jgi:hypothetical protein